MNQNALFDTPDLEYAINLICVFFNDVKEPEENQRNYKENKHKIFVFSSNLNCKRNIPDNVHLFPWCHLNPASHKEGETA